MLSSSLTECWVGLLFSSPLPGMDTISGTWMYSTFCRALLRRHLADGLQKGLALDVAHRAADLGDDHIGVCPSSMA